MNFIPDRYANWKAPAEDGQILIWPRPDQLIRDTLENSKLLASAHAVHIQNVPLSELRSSLRKWLGHDETPLVGTGHQTELYHPGVWVKHALTNATASELNGQAYHFAVDTDQPKHLNVRWPEFSQPVTDDSEVNSAAWSGLLQTPTPSHLNDLQNELATAERKWKFKSTLDNVLLSFRRLSMDSSNLSSTLTNAQHELDWDLGLRHHAMVVSPILFSEPYLAFAYHVLARADQFAGDYNACLADYRSQQGITSNMRPMPDLHGTADLVEVPFWLDRLAAGTRTRAEVVRNNGKWSLRCDEDYFEFDRSADGWAASQNLSAWLRQRQLRLAPRALTLTTFLRLLVVDQFVHGIGGGRYDQVSDRLIFKHFNLVPPKFAVTTATMFFPGSLGRTRVCLSCVAMEGHRLKHRLLGDRKQPILESINALPRNSVQRSLAFHNMHGALAAAAMHSADLKDWEVKYRQTEQLDREDEVIFDRELFYAIQPRERLLEMIAKYAQAFQM